LTLVATYQIPFILALLLTLVFNAILGMAIERVVLRPLINAPVISVIMATIGLSSLLAGLVHMIWGHQTRSYPSIFPPTPIKLGDIIIQPVYLWSFVIVMILFVIFTIFFKFSKMGLAMRAV